MAWADGLWAWWGMVANDVSETALYVNTYPT